MLDNVICISLAKKDIEETKKAGNCHYVVLCAGFSSVLSLLSSSSLLSQLTRDAPPGRLPPLH